MTTILGRAVALKVLPASLVHDAGRVLCFTQETRAASSLNHPHVVAIYEVGGSSAGEDDGPSSSRSLRLITYFR